MADDTVDMLTGLPGWTVTFGVATYQPAPDGWAARIRLVTVLGHAYSRWHVAIVDPTGVARYTWLMSRLVDARLQAERQVRGRNVAR